MNNTLTTIRWPGWRPVSMAVFAVTLIAFSSPGFAAKGGDPGPPVGGETPNNLSLPSIQTELQPQVSPLRWLVPQDAGLGIHYSYGCDRPEENGQFSYPNTSCVDSLDNPTVYYTAQECTDAVLPSPCRGYEDSVSRIYWQKVDQNDWWADDDGIATPTSRGQAHVAYVDWGDALEAVSWNERSVIRVETQPYSSTIPGFNPAMQSCEQAATVADDDCKIGFQMWHVSGQGITEHWGVRASDQAQAVSYNYDSPFQIIKSTTARLNLTKMVPGSATCSMPGGNPGDEPPDIGEWSPGNEPGDANWGGTCTLYDELYSIETSVGGKYVYGFNWRMRDVEPEDICGWEKIGFWRLTFYTPSPSNEVPAILFDDADAPNVAPPAVLTALRELPRTWFIEPPVIEPEPEPETVIVMSSDEDPDADDRLYRPVVDTVNNLTYIDICVIAKAGGGGGGGNGGGGNGGGGAVDDSTTDTKRGGIGGGIGGGRDASNGVGGGIGGGRDGNRGKGGKH